MGESMGNQGFWVGGAGGGRLHPKKTLVIWEKS